MDHVDADGRLRNCFQFMAAGRTHRWGGRVLQPQNLKTPLPGMDGLDFIDLDGIPHLLGGTQIDTALFLGDGTVDEICEKYDDPMAAMASSVRAVIEAEPGHTLISFDFAAIENVVIGWLSGDELILNVFHEGRDPYLSFGGVYMYHMAYDTLEEDLKKGNKTRRKICKPAVLGCGFGLGKGEERYNKKTGEIEASGLLGYARFDGN